MRCRIWITNRGQVNYDEYNETFITVCVCLCVCVERVGMFYFIYSLIIKFLFQKELFKHWRRRRGGGRRRLRRRRRIEQQRQQWTRNRPRQRCWQTIVAALSRRNKQRGAEQTGHVVTKQICLHRVSVECTCAFERLKSVQTRVRFEDAKSDPTGPEQVQLVSTQRKTGRSETYRVQCDEHTRVQVLSRFERATRWGEWHVFVLDQ